MKYLSSSFHQKATAAFKPPPQLQPPTSHVNGKTEIEKHTEYSTTQLEQHIVWKEMDF